MFTTIVNIEPTVKKITHETKLITLGSCFSEHIGKKLMEASFPVNANPFGILFNPASIKNSLLDILANKGFSKSDLFSNNSLWSSFSHSTLFSSVDHKTCLQNINSKIESAHKHLQITDFLLITFGTSWIYELKENGKVVSNCHKLPAGNFNRRRLSVDEITTDYTKLFDSIKKINPKIEVIFTISPVRHWKDGAHENNISKGVLLLAIDALCRQFDYVGYFPAYEIQMDELRDYRFYAEDMLHPSSVSINYIWKRFQDYCMSEETKSIIRKIEEIHLDEAHRPLHPDSTEHQTFLLKLEEKKRRFLKEYPNISL